MDYKSFLFPLLFYTVFYCLLIIHFDNHTIFGAYYNWDFGDSTTWSQLTSPYHTFDQVGTYEVTLMVESDHGCRDTVRGLVRIEYGFSFFVPSAFTPNGDGVNDVYFLMSTNIVNFNLNIFNRWGQLIFNSDQPSKGWDGTFGGKEVPDGVYIYLIDAKGVDNVIYKKTGHVTVLR